MELFSDQELNLIDAYWRAANYLSVGQIYLLDNPLLEKPLNIKDVKKRLLGHWGTTPGLNFLYAHLNRLIKKHDLDMIFLAGPGHGGPGVVANVYLEGTYSEVYPDITEDKQGLQKLFKQFSFPGGIPSHVAPETPGSIHEGGELGYVLTHAFGAVLDNPDLIAACVIGDGEAETGPLAASWHYNKFLNPALDGVVLPILHLNGFKIANPTVLARLENGELELLLKGYGYKPYFVVGDDPMTMHEKMAKTLEAVYREIKQIKQQVQDKKDAKRPIWPMIVLQSPKGWTGPKEIDGKKVEGSWRSHQVPFADFSKNPERIKDLEDWMKSYRPEELFEEDGSLKKELKALAPVGQKRMGANPHANGGLLLKDLILPDFKTYALKLDRPGSLVAESTRVLGKYLRDVMKSNKENKNFRVMGPDETASNRLEALFEVTGRTFDGEIYASDDEDLARDGRVMEILSEHLCQGWLEGYLLTGRHGLFSCYEAFIHIVDSMFNQHAKWLKTTRQIPWRKPIASLNYLLTSHVWRQDHNGFSHQDPGFIDHVMNKKAEVIRIYLPPDANTLLSVIDHCLKSRNYVNVIVAGKQPALQYLSIEQAIAYCKKGAATWDFASNDEDKPDVIIVTAGDIPTMEALACVEIIKKRIPEMKVRFINVIDLMVLQPKTEHPHGLSEEDYDALFRIDVPTIFAFHGYPWLIHRLTYKRHNHDQLHVRGYKEEGTTTTPFDMVVLNDLDRFHLFLDVVERTPKFQDKLAETKEWVMSKLEKHRNYIHEFGEDLPEIRDWKWS